MLACSVVQTAPWPPGLPKPPRPPSPPLPLLEVQEQVHVVTASGVDPSEAEASEKVNGNR